jgi:hypothetical protein
MQHFGHLHMPLSFRSEHSRSSRYLTQLLDQASWLSIAVVVLVRARMLFPAPGACFFGCRCPQSQQGWMTGTRTCAGQQ